MCTRNEINDIMYGQNWVEQMLEARRVIHFVPICNSGCDSPHAMVNSMINDPFYELPHRYTWIRRRDTFDVLNDLGCLCRLIK